MEEWDTPKLKLIELQNNKIKRVPKLKLKGLSTLDLGHNKIRDISQLQFSELPNIKNMFFSFNKN